jgi:glyoxylase-like metal-dependent hydrolase (beta-lactamase superfamily II)
METPGEIMARMPRHWLSRSVGRLWVGPPHPVSRRLREGDQVGTFTVIETPGHTAGHISFWREADRILITGDVLCNLNIWNGLVMLREPEAIFTLDPALNRRSARRLLSLEPRLVCFGHGPPLRDMGRFARFIQKLPAS